MSWQAVLREVPWSQLGHAYGVADDVPELLELLTQADAAEDIWALVLH